jgi:catalase
MDAAAAAKSVTAFIEALGRHRHPERETTPPRV